MVTNYATIKDAATALGVTERWLQMLCKQGKVRGAARVNNQGAWLIPISWIKAEQEKRADSTTITRKGVFFMKKIAFVFDDVSVARGEEVLAKLQHTSSCVCTKGVIPIYAHADEDEIVTSLRSVIKDADMVIGISSSGNGIAIYTNKISGFTAAPISSVSDINVATKVYGANAFDISAYNNELLSICNELIERMA